MHNERAPNASRSIPMHSSRLTELTQAAIKLPVKIVRLCINCVEWIWGYTANKNHKPITNIRTLEMSPELREDCFNIQKQKRRS